MVDLDFVDQIWEWMIIIFIRFHTPRARFMSVLFIDISPVPGTVPRIE